ncbi:MAG: adenylate/guanylate cyclase domain-containing protein [Gammaproteobacteria bacterium]|nr:adenylate/guanylate cyclase domain-containing protein [Gammaproteobacteria bacterium]MDH3534944.1 adenylate/guanylate cyclase domain-containing protein [Gammaproteobacteria bacterium]
MARETINCVVMFADVAGSTAMYENMGDDLARERISRALNTLISISQRHNGHLVKTIGDEILVYFNDVDMAVHAARAIQETMEDDRTPETIGVSIRIGMQYGSAILENDDIFGDTVNVAARIASMAKARQILCTQEIAFLVKSGELSNNMRPYDRLRVKGRNEQLDVYLFTWEQESDITNMATASNFTNPARYEQSKNLTLKYEGKPYSITTDTTSYILGRGKDCELIIKGDLISRYHSKIEHRRGKFIITDQSTNGTFVRTSLGQDIFLRREEFTLFGSGYISLGKKVDLKDENTIHFLCE